MLRNGLLFFVFSLLALGPLHAQSDSGSTGYVRYHEPAWLKNQVEKYKRANYASPGVEGFRLQIFSDGGNNAKDRANTALESFKSAFPDIPVYLSYQQPNFRVRAGDCRSRAEARKLQKRIEFQYPNAFLVRDHVRSR